MGLMDDVFAADATAICNEMGESLTYKTKAGVTTAFTGVVNRFPPQSSTGSSAATQPFIEVHMPMSVKSSINIGGDSILVAARYGQTAVYHLIESVTGQEGGMWILKLA